MRQKLLLITILLRAFFPLSCDLRILGDLDLDIDWDWLERIELVERPASEILGKA